MILKDNWDLFLLERGQFVAIRVDGQECGPTVERLAQAFPVLDLTGKNCLAFEPAIFRYEDDAAGVSISAVNTDDFYQKIVTAGVDGMVDTLNDLLNDFDRIKAEVEDPFFGMTPQEIAHAQTFGQLAQTDQHMARITEEVVNALDRFIEIIAETGVITQAQASEIKGFVTQPARDKIATRQSLRAGL